jgi:ribose transport system substrate-binding protein
VNKERQRRIVVAVMLGTIALLSGCGSSSSTGAATKTYKLAFIPGVKGDPFYVSMQCGIQTEAKKLGATVSTQGPTHFAAPEQIPIVQSVIASKPDAIIIAATDSTALITPLKQAAAAGIKIVLVDTTVTDPSMAVSQIATDNTKGGQVAAEGLLKLIGNKGSVMVVSVKPGISTTDQRAQGFQKGITSQAGVTFLGIQYDNDDPIKAASIVTSTLSAHPDLAGIFAANVFSAQGAATGAQQAGKPVKIVGFDAGPEQVQQLNQGLVQALVAQQPYQIGVDGVDQAVNALTGKSVTAQITTGATVITKDNISLPEGKDALYKSSC